MCKDEEYLCDYYFVNEIYVNLCSNEMFFDYFELYNVLNRKMSYLLEEYNIWFLYRVDVFWKFWERFISFEISSILEDVYEV